MPRTLLPGPEPPASIPSSSSFWGACGGCPHTRMIRKAGQEQSTQLRDHDMGSSQAREAAGGDSHRKHHKGAMTPSGGRNARSYANSEDAGPGWVVRAERRQWSWERTGDRTREAGGQGQHEAERGSSQEWGQGSPLRTETWAPTSSLRQQDGRDEPPRLGQARGTRRPGRLTDSRNCEDVAGVPGATVSRYRSSARGGAWYSTDGQQMCSERKNAGPEFRQEVDPGNECLGVF